MIAKLVWKSAKDFCLPWLAQMEANRMEADGLTDGIVMGEATTH